MTYAETVNRAVELYQEQDKKDLLTACIQANEEAGDHWNVTAVRGAAYKIIYK